MASIKRVRIKRGMEKAPDGFETGPGQKKAPLPVEVPPVGRPRKKKRIK